MADTYTAFWSSALVCHIAGKIMAVTLHPLCKDRARNLSKAEICFKEWNEI